jgi:hypothetical protein
MLAITGLARGTQFGAGEAVHHLDNAQEATNPGASTQAAENASPEGHGNAALTGLVPAGGLHAVVDGAVAKGKSKAETIQQFKNEMMVILAVLAINADPHRPSGLRG